MERKDRTGMMQHSRSSALPRIFLQPAGCQQNTVIGHTIALLCKSQSKGFWNVWTVEGDVLRCVVLTSCHLKPFPLSSELQILSLSHTHTHTHTHTEQIHVCVCYSIYYYYYYYYYTWTCEQKTLGVFSVSIFPYLSTLAYSSPLLCFGSRALTPNGNHTTVHVNHFETTFSYRVHVWKHPFASFICVAEGLECRDREIHALITNANAIIHVCVKTTTPNRQKVHVANRRFWRSVDLLGFVSFLRHRLEGRETTAVVDQRWKTDLLEFWIFGHKSVLHDQGWSASKSSSRLFFLALIHASDELLFEADKLKNCC